MPLFLSVSDSILLQLGARSFSYQVGSTGRRPTGLPARGSPPPPPQRSESGSPGIGRHKKEKRNTFQRLVHNDSHTLSAQRTTNDLSYRSLAPSFSRSVLRSSRSHRKRERGQTGLSPLPFPLLLFLFLPHPLSSVTLSFTSAITLSSESLLFEPRLLS